MSEATPEVLSEAKSDGWADKDQWRGDPSLWVDATEFVRRKHTVLPLLRKENEKINTALQATQAELTALRGNMDEFVKYQREQTTARLADQRKQLMAEKRAADEAGDDALVVQLEERLDENAEARAAAKVAPVETLATPVQQIPPEVTAWTEANPWFGKDQRKTGLAMGLGREAEAQGLRGNAYFAHIDKGLKEVFAPAPSEGKAEGGGPSGSSAPGSSSFNSLPPDAKAQCDADEKRFVGKGKLFADQSAWRTHYVSLYNQG